MFVEGPLQIVSITCAHTMETKGKVDRRDSRDAEGQRERVSHTHYLNLDVHLNELLREWVDLDEAGIHRTRETAKSSHQADITLSNGFVRVRTDDAAWNGAEATHDSSEGTDYFMIRTIRSSAHSILIYLDVMGRRIWKTAGPCLQSRH